MSKAKVFTGKCVAIAGNSRGLLGLLVVLGLTIISIRFNWELGKLSAPAGDEISNKLMPAGYALLDLAALFLCGYIGLKTQDKFRKAVAWFWFSFLLSLSLWAAMSFAISVDYRAGSQHQDAKIAALQAIADDRAAQVDRWQTNLDNTELYKTRYQGFLDQASREHQAAVAKLNAAFDQDIPPALAIYYAVAPLVGVNPDTMATIMRLVWAAGLTLSPLVVMMLVAAEFMSTNAAAGAQAQNHQPTPPTPPEDKKPKPHPRPEEPERVANFPAQQGNTRPFPAPHPIPAACNDRPTVAEKVEGVRGHNKHTPTLDLNGLKKASVWLEGQPVGRITRNKLQAASGVKGRESVSKIIGELINRGELTRLGNKQLAKPEVKQPVLRKVFG